LPVFAKLTPWLMFAESAALAAAPSNADMSRVSPCPSLNFSIEEFV
jgi:hypothetical protein